VSVSKLIPLDQPPSLHRLRSRLRRRFVRRLLRYYAAVRLPIIVHHRRSSLTSRYVPPLPSFHDGRQSALSVPTRYASAHARGLRPRGVCAGLAFSSRAMLPSAVRPGPRHPGFRGFRGSIPDLCFPLSTLQPVDCSTRRMTRSQPGSLGLGCSGLSPPTYRKLSDAFGRSPVIQRQPLTGRA
jgi:hypothetical protein